MAMATMDGISRHLSGPLHLLHNRGHEWNHPPSVSPCGFWDYSFNSTHQPPSAVICLFPAPPCPVPKQASLSLPTAHLHHSQSIFIECLGTSLTCLPARHLTPSTLEQNHYLAPFPWALLPRRTVPFITHMGGSLLLGDISWGLPQGDIVRKRSCSGSLSADKAGAGPAPLCCHPEDAGVTMQPFLLHGRGWFWHAVNQGWASCRAHDAECIQILLFLKFTHFLIFSVLLSRLVSVMHSYTWIGIRPEIQKNQSFTRMSG